MWFRSHRAHNKLMHIMHGNGTHEAAALSGAEEDALVAAGHMAGTDELEGKLALLLRAVTSVETDELRCCVAGSYALHKLMLCEAVRAMHRGGGSRRAVPVRRGPRPWCSVRRTKSLQACGNGPAPDWEPDDIDLFTEGAQRTTRVQARIDQLFGGTGVEWRASAGVSQWRPTVPETGGRAGLFAVKSPVPQNTLALGVHRPSLLAGVREFRWSNAALGLPSGFLDEERYDAARTRLRDQVAASLPPAINKRKSYTVKYSATAVIGHIRINVITILPWGLWLGDEGPSTLLSAAEIIGSFDMRQCAVALHVDAQLRLQFELQEDTWRCVRERRLVFSAHVGCCTRVLSVYGRIDKYLARGFALGGPLDWLDKVLCEHFLNGWSFLGPADGLRLRGTCRTLCTHNLPNGGTWLGWLQAVLQARGCRVPMHLPSSWTPPGLTVERRRFLMRQYIFRTAMMEHKLALLMATLSSESLGCVAGTHALATLMRKERAEEDARFARQACAARRGVGVKER